VISSGSGSGFSSGSGSGFSVVPIYYSTGSVAPLVSPTDVSVSGAPTQSFGPGLDTVGTPPTAATASSFAEGPLATIGNSAGFSSGTSSNASVSLQVPVAIPFGATSSPTVLASNSAAAQASAPGIAAGRGSVNQSYSSSDTNLYDDTGAGSDSTDAKKTAIDELRAADDADETSGTHDTDGSDHKSPRRRVGDLTDPSSVD
jgi:hypothetical protein